jgi:hypothetical protein
MHKLKLNLDALAVESFAADGEWPAPRGTVDAHVLFTADVTTDTQLDVLTCAGSCDRDTCG